MKKLLLIFYIIAGIVSMAKCERITLSNAKMEITLDNFTICSLKIGGVERLIQGRYKEFSPGIVIKNSGKIYLPDEIKLTSVEKHDKACDINGEVAGVVIKLSLASLPETIRVELTINSDAASNFGGCLVLPTSYEGIEYFRYDSLVTDKGSIDEKENLRIFNPNAGFYQKTRKNGFEKFPFRQIPIAVMNYEDRHYLSVERVPEKNFKHYTPVFLEGRGHESPVLSLLIEIPSDNPAAKMQKNAAFDLRGNSYCHNFFEQAMLDACIPPDNTRLPQDSVFDINHNAIPRGLSPSERMVVFSWGERDMCFDGTPTKSGYEKIRNSIIEAKKEYPDSRMLLYWSPTLHMNADLPGYNYSDEKKAKYTDCSIVGEDGKKTAIIYHGNVINYYQNMDPNLPYGAEVLKNVERLFREIPEADGLFWDNFYYGTAAYPADWDFAHKSSSLTSMVQFITALKQLPVMQKRIICANGGIEPYTAGLVDCYLAEAFPKGMAVLYPMRFGKPIYFLRKLGTLSLSEARYWNVYPNGSFIVGSFPFDCDPETWPTPIVAKGKIINPFEIYYPDAHRYVAFPRKYDLWRDAPKSEIIREERSYSLNELGFKIVGNEKPPFYVEYFQADGMKINSFQRYRVVKTFISNCGALSLQPHVAATLEPLNIKLAVQAAEKDGKRALLIKPMHGKNTLNTLMLHVQVRKDAEILYEATGKYIKDGDMEGFLLDVPYTEAEDHLSVILKNEQNEILVRDIPRSEFVENQTILTILSQSNDGKKSDQNNQVGALWQKETDKNDYIELKKYSAGWQNVNKWLPSSHRISMSEHNSLLKISYTPGTLYRWDNIMQYFTPIADWSKYRGLGMWLYTDDEDFNKMSLWVLHRHGHIIGKEAVKVLLSVTPHQWNYIFIDFSKFKFDFQDVWVIQLILDADRFKEKNRTCDLFIGDFCLIDKE